MGFLIHILGGPYSSFAGHDASRALAMFQTDLVKEEYDDLSDLDNSQMESIREWDAQLAGMFYEISFLSLYIYCGNRC